MTVFPYGNVQPDWYFADMDPDYTPVPPDDALNLLAALRAYSKKYPKRTRTLALDTLHFDSLELQVPGCGRVSYLYKERVCFAVYISGAQHDFDRVYRYLFLDQTSEEDTDVLHLIERCLREQLARAAFTVLPAPCDAVRLRLIRAQHDVNVCRLRR